MVVSNHWTGLLEWNIGLTYFGFTHFKGGHLNDL